MAVAPLQIPADNINALVPQSTWASLSNLGNVYQQAQAQRAKQAALASLGTDPKANLQTLLQSQDPQLAQFGLSLQEKGVEQAREDARYAVTDKRADAELGIRQAAARRAQQDWEEAERDRANAAKLVGAFGAPPTAPAAAPAAPPFPAPLPGAQGAPPPAAIPPAAPPPSMVPPATANAPPPVAAAPPPPSVVPQQPVASPPAAAPPVQGQPAPPSAWEATPRVPAELQAPAAPPAAPPIKAEGDDSALPSWLQSAAASPPDTSIIGRAASNLTSSQPVAAAGLSREQLGAMYANPLTRPLATALLQKQYDPGTWSYTKLDDGRLVATNNKTQEVKDVTPPTATGEPPASKEQRERVERYKDAIARGYDKTTADYVAINGKLPKEDLNPTEMKAVTEAQKMSLSGNDVLDNLTRLKELSKTAYSGAGATLRATAASQLPAGMIPQGATDTLEMKNIAMQNVAAQAKATFGARLAVAEVKLLNEIETTPEMSEPTRQAVYARLEKMIKRHVDASDAEAEGIKNKTYFKPSAATPAGSAPAGGAVDFRTYFGH